MTIKMFVLALLTTIVGFLVFRVIPVSAELLPGSRQAARHLSGDIATEAVDVAARTVAANSFPGWPAFFVRSMLGLARTQDFDGECLKRITA